VKSGRLSVAEKSDDGSFKIDPVELFRVFPKQQKTPSNEQMETPRKTGATPREIEFLQQMNAQQSETIADLRRRLDEERDERQRLSIMMLEHQKPTETQRPVTPIDAPKPKRKWWQKKVEPAV